MMRCGESLGPLGWKTDIIYSMESNKSNFGTDTEFTKLMKKGAFIKE